MVRGYRTEGYQAIRCPGCGEALFVLPRSPLPEPPEPSRPAKRRPDFERADEEDDSPIELVDAPPQPDDVPYSNNTDEEVEWVDEGGAEAVEEESEAAPAAAMPRPEVEIDWSEPKRPARKRRRAAAVEEDAADHDRRPRESRTPPGMVEIPGRKRRFSGRSLGLLGLAVITIVASTIGINAWQRYRERLPAEAEADRTAGIAALAEGKIDEARRRLTRAADSLKQLGVADERLTETRQIAAEVAIAVDLLQVSLPQLLDEAARLGESEWSSHFGNIYRGRSIAFDDVIEATQAEGGYRLSSRVFCGVGPEATRTGRFDLAGLKLIEEHAPKVKERVVFGARLESVDLVDGTWAIRFAPESGVWLTHPDVLNLVQLTPRNEAE
jgi:hypothetical protein